jgi:hypothetical protein
MDTIGEHNITSVGIIQIFDLAEKIAVTNNIAYSDFKANESFKINTWNRSC